MHRVRILHEKACIKHALLKNFSCFIMKFYKLQKWKLKIWGNARKLLNQKCVNIGSIVAATICILSDEKATLEWWWNTLIFLKE